MDKVLVFTATYNEVDNIVSLVETILATLPSCDVLVVDDNSPDGTARSSTSFVRGQPRLHVIHRPGKNGLGIGPQAGHEVRPGKRVRRARHDGRRLLARSARSARDDAPAREAEFVIGSRYVAGGSCEYPLSRVVLSTVANFLTRAILSIPVHETTTAYRGFRRSLLERMDVDAIRSEGYSYFVESIYQVKRLTDHGGGGLQRMAEFPIRFADRRAGSSKISKKEIWKGFSTLFRLGVQRAVPFVAGQSFRPSRPGPSAPPAKPSAPGAESGPSRRS